MNMQWYVKAVFTSLMCAIPFIMMAAASTAPERKPIRWLWIVGTAGVAVSFASTFAFALVWLWSA